MTNNKEKTLFCSGFVEKEFLDPHWVVGFVDGEGCFHVCINKTRYTLRTQILPEFTVVQHSRDVQVLERMQQFFQ